MTAAVIISAILLTYLGAPVCFRDWRKTGARLAHFCVGKLRQSAPVFFIPFRGEKTGATGADRRSLKTFDEKETGAMISFDTVPDVGTVVILDRQEYELAGTRPHQKADGSIVNLLVWETTCPVCKGSFETLTARNLGPTIRRCQEHRKAGKPVKGRRGRRLKVAVLEA
jgi:hypothetical protein